MFVFLAVFVRFEDILKGLFYPACLARAVAGFGFVVTIFMGHENGDNKAKARDDTCRACWMKQTLSISDHSKTPLFFPLYWLLFIRISSPFLSLNTHKGTSLLMTGRVMSVMTQLG